jgi:beta-glucuronidase
MFIVKSFLTLCLVSLCVSRGAAADDDMADHPRFAHAMDVRTEQIDGFPVVFHYGQVRPEFNHYQESPTRVRTALNNGWLFRFDAANEGTAAGWSAPSAPSGAWTPVTIPHCWDMMPGGRFHDWSDTSPANPPHYNGAAWYRLEFDCTPKPGKRQRIEFLGVQQRARIHLNGREIALHEGGGQPFSLDVTDTLRPGMNLLALKVIRRANHQPFDIAAKKEPKELEQIHGPHPKAPDNWPYAGITREVTLIEENPVTIRKTQVRTKDGHLEAAVVLSNPGTAPLTAKVALESPALVTPPAPTDIELPPGKSRVVRLRAALRPDAAQWAPKSPVLHPLHVRLISGDQTLDAWHGRYGIRSFRIRDSRFVLNNQAVFLKGVAVYEETPARGAALLPSDHQHLFTLCRAADANFLRLHVGQRHPLAYQLADRMGFMVTAEWGGFWYREKSMAAQSADPRSIYQSHARCAIWDLMNHPSVVLWCSHNESHQFCPEYATFVAKGTALVRGHDWHLRPVTWAAWHPHKGEPHFEHADAVGFNEYRGAMDPFEDLAPDLKRAITENPGKPLLILENGGWSRLGKRGGKDHKGTEDWQADLLRRQHAVLTTHIPPLAGYTHWLLTDYRSRKFYTADGDSPGYSSMGMYSPDGKPKLVRDVFRDLDWKTNAK